MTSMQRLSDEEIIDKYFDSDIVSSQRKQLLEELLSRHYDWLMKYCLIEIKNTELAFDTVQDTLEKVVTNLFKFKKESKFKTWVFGIAKNTILKNKIKEFLNIKKVSRFSNESQTTIPKNSEELLIKSDQNKNLITSIRKLPAKQREAILAHYFEGKSIEGIATESNSAVGTVKANLFKARENLKKELKNER